jgi:hypothetical protein
VKNFVTRFLFKKSVYPLPVIKNKKFHLFSSFLFYYLAHMWSTCEGTLMMHMIDSATFQYFLLCEGKSFIFKFFILLHHSQDLIFLGKIVDDAIREWFNATHACMNSLAFFCYWDNFRCRSWARDKDYIFLNFCLQKI